MKKFLKNIAMFTLLLISLAWGIQLLIDLRIRNRAVHGVDNLDISPAHNDLIFMGSSRCLSHFNPSLFENTLRLKAMNLGVDGHSELSMHILRLQNYLAKNEPPRFAILALDPLVSAGSMTDNTNFIRKNSFSRYAFLPSKVNGPIVDYFGYNVAERYIPLYALLRYKLFLDCLTMSNAGKWDLYGYDQHDEQWDINAHPANRKLAGYFFDTTAVSLRMIEDRLNSIDSICKAHHIRLICVQTPIYKQLYSANYFRFPAKFCADLHLPFFDLNSDEIDGDAGNFYDIDHLNTVGVDKMTRQLFSIPAFLQLFRQNEQASLH